VLTKEEKPLKGAPGNVNNYKPVLWGPLNPDTPTSHLTPSLGGSRCVSPRKTGGSKKTLEGMTSGSNAGGNKSEGRREKSRTRGNPIASPGITYLPGDVEYGGKIIREAKMNEETAEEAESRTPFHIKRRSLLLAEVPGADKR